MMARSTTRSNQRPDTLMQNRSPPARQNPLATHGRTIHSGHSRPMDSAPVSANVRCPSDSDRGAAMQRTTLCAISDMAVQVMASTIHGTHVPVEKPSTASIGDIAHLVKNERGRELRRPKQEAPATTMTVTTGVSQCGSDPKGANQKGRNPAPFVCA